MSTINTPRERGILFNGAMVRALLAGTKTQTRRVMAHQVCEPGIVRMKGPGRCEIVNEHDVAIPGFACQFGQPGDRLWVRETFMDLRGTGIEHRPTPGSPMQRYAYAADCQPGSYADEARKGYGLKWRPSIHMPRGASRITLEITDVRVERLQDISDADCIAEGISELPHQAAERGCWWTGDVAAGVALHGRTPFNGFRLLWESTGGHWDENPWVWVVEFRRVERD